METSDKTKSEGLAVRLMAARIVGAYSDGRGLSNKMEEILRLLIIENMKESATDEGMEDILYNECTSRRLDVEEVMKHFNAISSGLQGLLRDDK